MNTSSLQGTLSASEDFGLPQPVELLRTLGPRQYSFWMLQQLVPHSAVSNMSVALRTTRPLRWWPLHAAVNHLLARHPALRTRFPAAAGVPVRHVSAASDVQLTVEVGAVTDDDLMRQLQEVASRPFDLSAELPMRVYLYQVSDGGSAILLLLHHMICDAVSLAMLADELARAYDGIAAGTGIPDDLSGEVRVDVEAPSRSEDVRFWSSHLRGLDTTQFELPWARPSPTRPTFAGATMVTSLAPETLSAVGALRRSLGSTENLVLLSAFYLTLFRHGAGPDLVVGVQVSSRASSAVTSLGYEVSTLPLRLTLDPAVSFAQLSREVRDVFLTGLQHAAVSVEEVLVDLGHHSPDWRVPLFRHVFNYKPWDETDILIGGERPASPPVPREESRLDLQLTVFGGQQDSTVVANYSTEVHDEADVVTLLSRMQMLVRAAADDPHRPVIELDMATDAERAVMAAVNDTSRTDTPDRTVFARFFRRAQDDPTATAVVDDAVATSYGELVTMARRVAARLRADGVGNGDIVALALPRGAQMAAAVFGVWAAGACYLPVDAGHPRQRLATQLSDAGARLVIVESAAVAPDGFGTDTRVLAWPDVVAGPDALEELDVVGGDDPTPEPDAAAYVIYTSGSTGTPRGVVISHDNLANVVRDFTDRLAVTAADAVLWSTTTAFDISALELYLPLSTGGTVVVAGAEALAKPRELLELIVKHDVSVAQATPTTWRLVVAEATGDELRGRTVLCGGEPMSATLARDLLGTGCRLYNVYGPTETTIWSTVARIDTERTDDAVSDPVPIGAPIANTTVFIADEYGAPLPPALLGELCIAGTGVSLGYLRRPEATAERFRSSPTHGRYYRTGDLARWRPDGVLELFGRNDRQVKVRGHRIELPEIEAVLRSHPDVTEAAVVVVGDPQSDAELRGFVRPVPGAATAALSEELWQYLSEHLPPYSLPSRLMVLPQFPTTPNGKTDHAALRVLDVTASTSGSGRSAGGPGGTEGDGYDRHPDLTRRLLALWRNTLGRPGLAEADHFFLNGGHSLLAVQLAGRIAEMVGKDVPVRAIFDHPTARRLAAHLAEER